MGEPPIDVNFDFQDESGKRDPDSYSPTLRRYHQVLWSKPLPSGELFDLRPVTIGSALALQYTSADETFVLSSDTLANSNRTILPAFYDAMGSQTNQAWHRDGGRIGGRLVFPRTRVDGAQTINQARGTDRRIRDRFDLTLEAIRRHYEGEVSPLKAALDRYSSFFALFGDFDSYVRFFLLDDLVDDGRVQFYVPFRSWDESPLPQSMDEYRQFRDAQLSFVVARNHRILLDLRARSS